MSMYNFLDKDPEKNLPKLMNWLDRYISPELLQPQREIFREIIEKKDGNWYQLIVSLWSDIDSEMRKTLFENIVINSNALAASKAEAAREENACNIPWVIAIELGDEEGSLDFDKWDDVIEQAKALGTFVFLFQDERSLNFKEEIIALCNKHRECEFMVLTTGEGLDTAFIKQVLRVKNLIINIKANTIAEMDACADKFAMMHEYKLPYSMSVLYDESTEEQFATEEFFDKLVSYGIKLALLLSEKDGDDKVYRAMQEARKTKPVCTIHFCNDIAITGGCVAGGKYYCHINSKGDVEPCFFVSLSDSNVKECSLLDAYKAPLFKSYYKNNSGCMMQILKKSGYNRPLK